MPRELITIQVGQCGNQIGLNFWDLVLKEYSHYSALPNYDDSLSTFFRNLDSKTQNDLGIGSELQDLKARGIIIDMESGVIENKIMNGPLKDLFSPEMFISDNPGCGNNWAVGFMEFGEKYKEMLENTVRRCVEYCDSLQGFFFLHSLGGGTGSGFGTFALKSLADLYPSVFKFSACVMPSRENDDVIISPYNSFLATNELIEHADCVLPIDNQALYDIVSRVEATYKKSKEAPLKSGAPIQKDMGIIAEERKSYDRENSIIAHLLNNLTCSMRFEGPLNVDLNEIAMNLVPYPNLHFLLSSLTPLYTLLQPKLEPRNITQMFTDALDKHYQLLSVNMHDSLYLACGLIMRGDIQISVLNENVSVIKKKIRMPYWNQEGFKIGLCSQPALNTKHSLLCLSNNTCVKEVFADMTKKFINLYNKEVYLHHFTQHGVEKEHFQQCIENFRSIIEQYKDLDNKTGMSKEEINQFRYKPMI